MKSSITLYSVPFSRENRFLFDDVEEAIGSYGGIVEEISDFQFVKMASSIELKIDWIPLNPFGSEANYCRVVNLDDEGREIFTAYYFVESVRTISSQTSSLSLTLDVLNTFSDSIEFTNRTRVIREHKDRFWKLSNNHIFPKIDWMSEGLDFPKLLISERALGINRGKWHLLYRSSGNDESSGIDGFVIPENPVKVSWQSGSAPITASQLAVGRTYGFPYEQAGGISFKLNDDIYVMGGDYPGDKKIVGVQFANENGSLMVSIETEKPAAFGTIRTIESKVTANIFNVFNFSSFIVYSKQTPTSPGITWSSSIYKEKDNPSFLIESGDFVEVGGISSIDRSDSKIVKLISLPYPPFDEVYDGDKLVLPNGFAVGGEGMIKIADISKRMTSSVEEEVDLNDEVTLPSYGDEAFIHPSPTYPRDIHFETKLLHGDFLQFKFAYDSFFYSIPLEDMILNKYAPAIAPRARYASRFDVRFVQSSSISSAFLIEIIPSALSDNSIVKSGDYDGFVIVKRNNELPIFSNAYINYIRNGYNYDLKSQSLQVSTAITSTAVSLVGTLASFALAPATGGISVAAGIGLATSSISSGVSIARQVSQNQISNAARLTQLQNQGTAVSGSDDLSLLEYYNGMRIHLYKYWLSDDDMKKAFDLFFYKGYACDQFKIPNIKTRRYFNFVQCEADLNKAKIPNGEIRRMVENEFASGVTFMHSYSGIYDISQEYENFELALD